MATIVSPPLVCNQLFAITGIVALDSFVIISVKFKSINVSQIDKSYFHNRYLCEKKPKRSIEYYEAVKMVFKNANQEKYCISYWPETIMNDR